MDDGSVLVSVKDRLLRDRNALLDLSARNRLLNTPLRTRNVRTIEVVDEKTIEVHRLLEGGKSFTFLPGRLLSDEEKAELAEGDTDTGGIPQPEDEGTDERGIALRHTDLKLQTRLTSEGLQKRLFDIWYDARTLEEEQGVNILYLGLGLLKWFEADSSDLARHAPLALLPVELVRTSAADKFKLKARSEPVSPNLSLQAKLRAEFSIILEDFPDEDDLDLAAYFQKVSETISKQKRWEVLPNAMVLGFFSFAKFLMYRDLDPETWPANFAIDAHPIISGLLRDGFPESEPLVASDGEKIDPIFSPATLNHVVDADSSQTVAIEEAAHGRTLVVKGPPGTGKSQTITNVIAAAAAQGKKILFVAEKMAALDVVYRRLKDAGLGALTLELHSNKANKRAILEELKRTRELALKAPRGDATVIQKLTSLRDLLNAHADGLHVRQEPYGLTPFQIIGQMVRVSAAGAPDGIKLSSPETWTSLDREKCEDILEEVSERLDTIGNPAEHAWRGVQREALDPTEASELRRRLESLRSDLHDLKSAALTVTGALLLPEALSLEDLKRLAHLAATAINLPDCDRPALSHAAWSRPDSLRNLLEIGTHYSRLKSDIEASFNDLVWQADLMPCRTAIVTKGKSLFRFLDSNYRMQIALLRSYLNGDLPKQVDTRLALVDTQIAARAARTKFESSRSAGDAFGRAWKDLDSDWERLGMLITWRESYEASVFPVDFLSKLSALPDLKSLAEANAVFNQMLERLFRELEGLTSWLDLDLNRAFYQRDLQQLKIDELLDRIELWLLSTEQLSRWIAFTDRCRAACDLGLGDMIDKILSGSISSREIRPAFDQAYYEAVRADLFVRIPWLKKFDGELHSRHVENFRTLDLTRMALAREQIAFKHLEAVPRGNGGVGPLGVLNGEMAKKRNHLPIRQLLEKAGPVIQELKPVFMMSPLSVAQFLKPGAVSFDILVMDEASQIEPIDALGAIARAKQIVVVGDERQLPPTRFFSKLTSDIDEKEDEDETFAARDAESILDLCLAKGIPSRMLNWHYRSRHQSLIAVSNREFYDNKLFIVPSPYDAVAGMGLKFHHLPHGHYERGGTRTNPIEAKTVAEAVIQHARTNPAQTLGVAAFSVAQRQAIIKELELLRRANPDVEDFFNRSSTEPFFVKNLENIQGDERDVIFISVGYGRNAAGYMAMNFGPLSGDGGERRLNVLISRAKLRCEIFSSIIGDDIDLERSRARGVAALKLFLTFAQTGKFGLAEPTGRGPDSVFEEQVAEKLKSLGYDVKTQIGTAGFFVDLAIGDPEKPGRFVLGIECDGAQYHSSRSARDRDRLRQRVLEDHGWIIHRIWSTDWYLRPEEELKKVQAAVSAAIEEWRSRDEIGSKPRHAVPLQFTGEEVDEDVEIVMAHVGAIEEEPISVPYVEATFAVNRSLDPHEVPLGLMATYVSKIVELEGPVHEDEIVTRIRTLWGLQRAGNRIRDAVSRALATAKMQGAVTGGPFYVTSSTVIKVRDRSAVASAGLRKPEYISPAEIEVAMVSVVDRNFGATRDELVTTCSRAFGYASTSAQIRAVLEPVVEALHSSGRFTENGGIYKLSER